MRTRILQQPLDLDPTVITLFDKYPPGTGFSQEAVAKLFDRPIHWARQLFAELKETLADCPEGPQLYTRRGSIANGGGTYFSPSVDT